MRRGIREPFELLEGVPEHIWAQMRPLLLNLLADRERFVDFIAVRLHIPVSSAHSRAYELISAVDGDDDSILDVLDMYVRIAVAAGDAADRSVLSNINMLLEQGHSAWRLNVEDGRVERRVSDEATAMYESIQSEKDRVAERLSDAWRFVFGRSPDPSAAWDRCTKAIEAALKPIVSPKNSLATYGTIVRDLEQKPAKWDADMRGATAEERTLAFIDLLKQVPFAPDRHEGDAPPPISLDVARSVVIITTSILEIVHQEGLRSVKS